MPWALLVAGNLIASVWVNLERRRFAEDHQQLNTALVLIFFVALYPLGLIYATVLRLSAGNDLGSMFQIGWKHFAIIVLGSLTFPCFQLLSLRASQQVDAGVFTVLSNLHSLLVIGLGILVLGEIFSGWQLVGAAILLASALLVSVPSYRLGSHKTKLGIAIAVAGIVFLSVGTIFEKWILGEIGLPTYLIYGWGMQTVWISAISLVQRTTFGPALKPAVRKATLRFTLARLFTSFTFITSLHLGQASSLAAYRSFTPVLVVVAAFILLNEKNDLRIKAIAASLGTAGLIMISLFGKPNGEMETESSEAYSQTS